MKNPDYAFFVVVMLALTACATPGSVRDQSTHGIALTSRMALELKEFKRNEENAERFMVNRVVVQQVFAIGQMKNFRETDLPRQAVGDAATQRVIDNLNAYLRGLADSDAMAAEALQTSNRTLADLLAPLPDTAAATTGTQAKFAGMAEELPWSVRRSEFEDLANAIGSNIRDNKKKIKEARAKMDAKSATLPQGQKPALTQ